MSKKVDRAYRKGIEAGAQPFAEIMGTSAAQKKEEQENLKEFINRTDTMLEIGNPGYRKVKENLERENSEISTSIIQFKNYYIEECISTLQDLFNKGQYEICYYLGEIFSHGYGNTAIDKDQSFKFFQTGYYHNDELCKLKIAEEFPLNLPNGITTKDIICEFLQKFENNPKNEIISYEIGYIYENGICVDIDLEKAFRFYLKASENGNGFFAANYKLSRFYQKGLGTEINLLESDRLSRKCNGYDGR